MEWWWATGKTDTFRTTLWSAVDGGDVAFLSVVQSSRNAARDGVYEADCAWLPSADAAVRATIVPTMVARLAALPASPAAPVAIIADERDPDFRARLEASGFRSDPAQDFTQMWRAAGVSAPAPLPSGFRFDDERSRAPERPHHLTRRNGPNVAERLREGAHYRPDLDLRILAEDGGVVAYCLCWLDARNGVGLFEPVRTEDAYQRRGLGRALMSEGIRRLEAGGATTIRVTRMTESEPAAALYRGVGFRDAFQKRQYERQG